MHLPGVVIEVDVLDLRFLGDDLAEMLFHVLGVLQSGGVRSHVDAAAKALGDLSHHVVPGGEGLHVLGIDDH
ncbi:hypothetical protein DSECCO2_597970 [anaerobic digester metagenome]